MVVDGALRRLNSITRLAIANLIRELSLDKLYERRCLFILLFYFIPCDVRASFEIENC